MLIIGKIEILLFDQITVVNGDGVGISLLKAPVTGERISLLIRLFVPDI